MTEEDSVERPLPDRAAALFRDMREYFAERGDYSWDAAGEVAATELIKMAAKAATDRPVQGLGVIDLAREEFVRETIRVPNEQASEQLADTAEELFTGKVEEMPDE